MPYIKNASMQAIKDGLAVDTSNAVLIQITDICYEPPKPANEFLAVYTFEFMDIDKGDPRFKDIGISLWQAADMIDILKHCLKHGYDVIVHCHAGLCRSGAVAEVGVMMGFEDTGAVRQPNSTVKWSLMKELGWTYD